jgi:hypothetical protein
LKAAIAAAVVLSVATYWLLEKPVRHFTLPRTYRRLAPLGAATALMGAAFIHGRGFPDRAAAADMVVNEGEIDHHVHHAAIDAKFHPCEPKELLQNASTYENGPKRCHQSKAGTDYDLILVGDSHVEHLFYGLATALPDKNVVYMINLGMPVPENNALEYVYRYLLQRRPEHKPATIILGTAWVLHASEPDAASGMIASVRRFQTAGYRVFITDDVPFFPFDPSLCKMRRRLSLRPQRCRETSSAMRDAEALIQSVVAKVAEATGAPVLRTYAMFKDGDAYLMAQDGRIFYRDPNHLNLNGSMRVARMLERTGQLRALVERPEREAAMTRGSSAEARP